VSGEYPYFNLFVFEAMAIKWGYSMDGLEGRNNRHTKIWKNLEDLNVKVPSFQGSCDPEAYLKWGMKIE